MSLDLLRKIPVLAQLDEGELTRLLPLTTPRSFGANEPVIWVGDAGDELFMITAGRVVVTCPDENGREQTLATLQPGDFFGEVALLDGGPRTASVRTVDPSEMLVLKREDFHAFLRQNPGAAIDVLTTIGKRHRETIERLRGVTNPNAVIEKRATAWHRAAETVAAVSASQWFLIGHAVIIATWMAYNLLKPEAFDVYPFAMLALIISIESIFLTLFLLASADRSSRADRIRAEAEYQVNLKAQYEIMQLHAKVDKLATSLASKKA
jgi:CRP/FNR family transcriptional regulator, cyclic AMP receptor protein